VQNNFARVEGLPFFTRLGGFGRKTGERAQAKKEG